MNDFVQYRRSQIAELRPYVPGEDMGYISVSQPDKEAGSPKIGDMIARNPANHDDQWLVAAKYFADNFEPMPEDDAPDLCIHGQPGTINCPAVHKATPAGSFFDRLKIEREELEERLIKLNSYLTENPGHPSPRQSALLHRQSDAMSEYLVILDERIADIEISLRSTEPETVKEI